MQKVTGSKNDWNKALKQWGKTSASKSWNIRKVLKNGKIGNILETVHTSKQDADSKAVWYKSQGINSIVEEC